MSNIVPEGLQDCPEAIGQHWSKVVIWPSGDLTFAKTTKRCALNLTNPAKLRKPRVRRGLKGLTPYGRRVVRSAANLQSHLYGKGCLSFITATVPDLDDEHLEILVDRWGAIAHRFCEEIGRELMRHGIKNQYLYVTEIQPKRWESTHRAYPHLHMVVKGRKSTGHSWALTTRFMSEVWKRVLENHIGQTLDKPPITQIQRIKRSVVSYLSKYLSKGLGSLKDSTLSDPPPLLPSAWYGLSRSLLNLVRVWRFELTGAKCRDVSWLVGTCFHSNKASCSVLSLLDERTGFMWPIAMVGYIYSQSELRQLYDSFYDGKHPFKREYT